MKDTVFYISHDCPQTIVDDISLQSGIQIIRFDSIDQLFQQLGSQIQSLSGILIDLDTVQRLNNTTPFDVVHTLTTIINCFGVDTKIAMGVKNNTSVSDIKEILNIAELSAVYLSEYQSDTDRSITALRKILSNEYYVSPSIKSRIKKKKHKVSTDKIKLTPRQSQVLNLVVSRGSSNKAIAKILKISESTVKLHITAVLKKFGCQNRTQLALFCKDKYTLD
jgi:DNA-binding CsgD family transcriptional regulator